MVLSERKAKVRSFVRIRWFLLIVTVARYGFLLGAPKSRNAESVVGAIGTGWANWLGVSCNQRTLSLYLLPEFFVFIFLSFLRWYGNPLMPTDERQAATVAWGGHTGRAARLCKHHPAVARTGNLHCCSECLDWDVIRC